MSTLESTAAAASAATTLRREVSRARRIPERVQLHDADTISADEITPGDVFVHAGALYVALSSLSPSGVVHAYPYADRTTLVTVQLHSEEPVLTFV